MFLTNILLACAYPCARKQY